MAKLFGKKQESAAQDAAVSSIPVPPSDSALVIDLPEGQKLVIGKMEEGTVIEVATWRGTGRPDSRTNRLMLGVSFGTTQAPESAKQEDELDLANVPAYQRYIYLARKLLLNLTRRVSQGMENLKPLAGKYVSKLKGQGGRDLGESIREISGGSESEKDFDIDKWLDSVRSNSRVSKLAGNGTASSGVTARSGRSKSASKGEKSVPKAKSTKAKRPASRKKAR